MSRVINLARRAYDYVIVDTFPMLDSIVIAILDLADTAFIVLQGTAPTIVGMAKFLPVLDSLGVPVDRQRLILNRNYPNFAGNLHPSDVESRLHRQIDYVFPYQRRLLTAMNTGNPYILHAIKFFGFAKALSELVHDIEAEQGKAPALETIDEDAAPDATPALRRGARG